VGAFATGQTLKNSIHTGFSMAQIGEFSFIIASLGLAYNAIDESIYPIIVAASLVTTFTTPYLIKSAGWATRTMEASMSKRTKERLDRYVSWVQQRSVASESRKQLYRNGIKWALNAVVVITLFTIGAERG